MISNSTSLFYNFDLALKVWDDVAIHCREFIQEYLEEYPDVSI